MSRKSDDVTVRVMAEKAKDWFTSEEGKRELEELFKRAEEAKQELSEASRVELDSLNKPVTL